MSLLYKRIISAKEKRFWLLILMVLLYLIQFIVFPRVFPYYFRISNEATWLFWSTHLLVALVAAIGISGNFVDWLFADFAYLALIAAYSADGAYGTYLYMYSRASSVLIELAIIAAVILLFQGFISGIVFLAKKYIVPE